MDAEVFAPCTFRCFTVDVRRGEFRKVSGEGFAYVPFGSERGRLMMADMRECLAFMFENPF